jgi:hypothetical protein
LRAWAIKLPKRWQRASGWLRRWRFGFGFVFGIHLGNDVVYVLLCLGKHFLGLLANPIGASDILGKNFGTSIVTTPRASPGSKAASKAMTPTPTTATVATVATAVSKF